jgi:Restriction endonuclease XhoI
LLGWEEPQATVLKVYLVCQPWLKVYGALNLSFKAGTLLGIDLCIHRSRLNGKSQAIGTAHDFCTAYREGAFGKQSRPFVGWLMLVEDAPASRSAVRDNSPHFPVFEEFKGASYLQRYDLLCQRLVQEQLYTSAALIASPRTASQTGEFSEMSMMTGMKPFVSTLAGHVAAAAARLG